MVGDSDSSVLSITHRCIPPSPATASLPKSLFHVLSPPVRERGCSGKLVIDTLVAAILLMYTYCVPVTPFIVQYPAHGDTVR